MKYILFIIIFLIYTNYKQLFNKKFKIIEIPKGTIVYHTTKEGTNMKYDNRFTFFSKDKFMIYREKKCIYNSIFHNLLCKNKSMNDYIYISPTEFISDYKNNYLKYKIKILKFKTIRPIKVLRVDHENVLFSLKYFNNLNKLNIDGFMSNKKTHQNTKDTVYLIKLNNRNFSKAENIEIDNIDDNYSNFKYNCGIPVWSNDLIRTNLFEIFYINNNIDKLNYFIEYHNKSYNSSVNKKNIRISSYNVHEWTDCFINTNYINIIKNILDTNSDIVCLQESPMNTRIIKILRKYYPNIYYSNYLAILSKYKILETKKHTLGRDNIFFIQRYCLYSKISYNNKIIHIFNAHLDVYDNTEKTRYEQIKIILNQINKIKIHFPNDLIILCGDFNSLKRADYSDKYFTDVILDKPKYLPNKFLVIPEIEKNLYDCKSLDKEYKNKTDLITVWTLRKVDYIFINKKINLNYRIKTTDDSDHYITFIDI